VTTKLDATVHLWLPTLSAMDSMHPLREFLRRADRLADGRASYLGGLGDYFRNTDGSPITDHLPAAAITREYVAGNAGAHAWLSADPAWVQPEMNGARLLACGQLQLTMAEANAFADTLRASFDDAGMALDVSTPDRWHLRLPSGTLLPTFAAPEQALGEDLSQHIPQGPEGRRWRVLLNDIQVLLHQHPLNAERRARGLAPVNSVWLWGGGSLPTAPRSELAGVVSDDLLLTAMAKQAGLKAVPRTSETIAAATKGWLIDLQDLPISEIESQWWPILQPLLQKQSVRLHFASAERWQSRPWHRWRVWRRARH
jgi:hypothetical protein